MPGIITIIILLAFLLLIGIVNYKSTISRRDKIIKKIKENNDKL